MPIMKKLPVGKQDFSALMEGGFVYIDKTELIHQFLKEGAVYCFLARPRRFGKSLLVSLLQSLFRGERHLFEETWIGQSDYDWPKHPVLRLDFSRLASTFSEDLLPSLNRYLRDVARPLGVDLELRPNPGETLALLVEKLSGRNKVVILIDEYDRPIVKHMADPELMAANREALQDFFAVIKSLEDQLRFVFITGVSKFSKVSLFSGMNNLRDISLHPAYATLTGLTEQEIGHFFSDHVAKRAEERGETPTQLLEQMRFWYNGYRFARTADATKVFNPWSVISCLDSGEVENFWFTSGTPQFAIQLIREQGIPLVDFERGINAGQQIEANFDVDSLDVVSLLFQTGYLTIDEYDANTKTYRLTLPNEEVRRSLFEHLFHAISEQPPWKEQQRFLALRQDVLAGDIDRFFKRFNELLASIPYPIHIAEEKYYHSLIYLALRILGFDAGAEVMTNDGRIDMIVSTPGSVFIFEFKINGSARKALKQIKETDYPARYRGEGKALVLVGANFSSKSRSIDDWQVAKD
jgi:Predicted AAA-ATPase/PD-(D/E)XK nuclease superfamily